ncbi:MAG: hypothetical protein LBH11_07005 [Propionibacteriaceae bacterium]|nr:hypothetical protein [Propionibacteriaceae bacterium]
MKKITAEASRDGKFWLVYVPEVGHYTQARNLGEVETMAASLAATVWNVPIETVEAVMSVKLPEQAEKAMADARTMFRQSDELKHSASIKSREAASMLRAQGWGLKDIGEALGVSTQRAHQLVTA